MDILKWVLIIGLSLVLAVVVVGAIVVVYLKWKFGKLVSSLTEGLGGLQGLVSAMTSMPTFRITLKPMRPWNWHHAEGEQAVEELKACGFVEDGRYTTEESPDLRIVGLVHEARSLLAAVYDQAAGAVKVDVVFDGADGRHWTVTDVAESGMDRRVSEVKVRRPGASPRELFEAAVAEQQGAALVPVKRGEFVERFERAYAEEMDWRVSRGGFSVEEVRRVAGGEGGEVDDQLVEPIHIAFNARLRDGVEDALREELVKSDAVSEAQWEEWSDRVVLVYDMLPGDDVAYRLLPLKGDGDEEGDAGADAMETFRVRVIEEVEADSPRRVFAKMLAELPGGAAVRKVATLTKPVEADVYLMPEERYVGE